MSTKAPSSQTSLLANQDALLKKLLEGTSQYTGADFFRSLVKSLSEALEVKGAWVTELAPGGKNMFAHAFYHDGDFVEDFQYELKGTPCEHVVAQKSFMLIPERLVELFPLDDDLAVKEAVSYMGAPLLDVDGQIIGLLAALHTHPLQKTTVVESVFNLFAARATAELQRLRVTQRLQQREQQLRNLLEGAMDAIIELNPAFQVIFCNKAAMTLFACNPQEDAVDFRTFLHPEHAEQLSHSCRQLDDFPNEQQFLWLPENILARNQKGKTFHLEGTVSRYGSPEGARYCLLLRNVEDKHKAAEKIRQLKQETEYLRQEVQLLNNHADIIGNSPAMQKALQQVEQVAVTDATVLLTGETGTGKELFASAIHRSSRRKNKAFVKVNCAAIPASLMESEFFGHEKGAFTGATGKREGRFSLANGGTLFLDEIGELSYDLQAKLLRVLQEGEFEPVGSSRTQTVDVRVIAATNRDLLKQVSEGEFREDLYYRLHVFPIHIPPLRERGDDIVAIATVYAEQFARQMGKRMPPIDALSAHLLKAYPWPGNVRELRNVIERAVIISTGKHWQMQSAIPEMPKPESAPENMLESGALLNAAKLQKIERDNLIQALQRTGWRVSGPKGAAQLLGIHPSTLASRMKALGIERPH